MTSLSTRQARPTAVSRPEDTRPRVRRLLRVPGVLRGVRVRAAALASLVTALGFFLGDAASRTFPFGPKTRGVNDLGNQFVPFHAHLWDMLHGQGEGGLYLNWQSGYGSSFLPDLGTYLSSP